MALLHFQTRRHMIKLLSGSTIFSQTIIPFMSTRSVCSGRTSLCLGNSHYNRTSSDVWGRMWSSIVSVPDQCLFSSPEPKAHWWAYRIGRPLSSVVRRRPHFLNIFSTETTGPIKVKFHMERVCDRETKVCSNGPGHMTTMAAMPRCDKNLKQSSSPEPKSRWPWKLVCNIGYSSTTKFVQMMTLGWPWPILWPCHFDVLCFCMEKTIDFSETIVVYDIKDGRCSQLNEYMELMNNKGQGHSLICIQGHSDSTFSNFFF